MLICKNYKLMVVWLILLGMLLSFVQCTAKNETLVILSGSENEALEPILKEFERESGISVQMRYKGSVDIMLDLEKPTIEADAVWPANSIWISMGDKQHVVKSVQSIMTSPVVFGIRKSLAEQLGLTQKQVSVKDILQAITNKKLSFMMTSASQSNSGASAYIGFLYALLGNPETVTLDDLKKPQLKEDIRSLLSGINRSSGSSAWLKDLFLKGNYDAMVNYESVIIDTNRDLINSGKEPLYVVYPFDGLVISDSPLGYVNKSDSKKEEAFKKLQAYLLTPKIQDQILQLGRRTGFGGVIENADMNVFNPAWGIDVKKILSPIKLPSVDVIQEALNLYQTDFKKPSYTVFCLDFSGSMGGKGESQLKESMNQLLNQELSRKYLLQSSKDDIVVVIPFNNSVIDTWQVKGNDPQQMQNLIQKINNLSPSGGTDIYSPVLEGLRKLGNEQSEQYITSIVLMTDGQSNTGKTFSDLQTQWKADNKDIPVFSILFGEASEDQLSQIANLTRARIFDGKKDLIDAFKKVRGYN